MKKFVFTVVLNNNQESGVEIVTVMAKNMLFAVIKLYLSKLFKEDDISSIAIVRG